MKTRFGKLVELTFMLSVACWALGPQTVAQTPAGLSFQLYAGLSITGTVGTVYSVEYVTGLAQSLGVA